MGKIKVLLVDDQKLFVESLRTLLETYSDDIEVVGIANDGSEAIEITSKKKPDVILMDVRMPGINGVEATKTILEKFPDIHIMMLSTFDKDEYVTEALHYGASGYLLKDISPTELIASIRAINEGSMQISPSVARKLVEEIYEKKFTTNIEWYNILSKREKEIFKLISRGFDNQQIADELYIAEQTVRNYVSTIYSKLGIKDRFQIIQMANKIGIKEKSDI